MSNRFSYTDWDLAHKNKRVFICSLTILECNTWVFISIESGESYVLSWLIDRSMCMVVVGYFFFFWVNFPPLLRPFLNEFLNHHFFMKTSPHLLHIEKNFTPLPTQSLKSTHLIQSRLTVVIFYGEVLSVIAVICLTLLVLVQLIPNIYFILPFKEAR